VLVSDLARLLNQEPNREPDASQECCLDVSGSEKRRKTMSHHKLTQIAQRQRDHVQRDRLFVGLMAMLIAFFILAVGASSSNLVTRVETAPAQPRSIQEIIDTSVTACDSADQPVIAHTAQPRPTC
jgi:hypothetical protein